MQLTFNYKLIPFPNENPSLENPYEIKTPWDSTFAIKNETPLVTSDLKKLTNGPRIKHCL